MANWKRVFFDHDDPWSGMVEALPAALGDPRRFVLLEFDDATATEPSVHRSSGRFSRRELAAAAAAVDRPGRVRRVGALVALLVGGVDDRRLVVAADGGPDGIAVARRMASLAPTVAAVFAAYGWRRRWSSATRHENERLRTVSLLYDLTRRLDPLQPVDDLARTVLAGLFPLVPYDLAGMLVTVDARAVFALQPRGPMPSGVVARFRDVLFGEFENYSMGPALDHVDEHVLPAIETESVAVDDGVPLRSQLSVPLILRGGVFAGHVLLGSFFGDCSQATNFQLLSTVVNQVNFVLTSRRLLGELERQAKVDEMTGVYNYRTFRSVLGHEASRARRYGKSLALLMVDVDQFKAVNDTFGHQTGDGVLQGVARLLRDSRREVDTVARYGGEEFAMILPETDRHGAIQVAERLRGLVRSGALLTERTVTVSVGVACLGGDEVDEERLIGQADEALYRAKRTGRDRVVAYDREGTA